MAKILAIETSTNACSAALKVGDKINFYFELAPQKHSQLILPMVEKLLSECQINLSELDAIAFGCGPGSFTGVRLAASVTQGLAFASNLPVIKISPLRAMAQQAFRVKKASKVLVLQDARMQEVYAGQYKLDEKQFMQEVVSDYLIRPENLVFPQPTEGWVGIGDGWRNYADNIPPTYDTIIDETITYPHAEDIAFLAEEDLIKGKTVLPEKALPVYLRNEVAWKKDSK